MRDAVRSLAFDLPAGGRRATISVGVAVARTTDGDVQDVLRRADEAFCEVERRGSEGVCVADAGDLLERSPAVCSVAEEVAK